MRDDSSLPEAALLALFDAAVREREQLIGERITPREREILYHRVVRGLTNKEIAADLVISIRTVEAHLQNATLRLRYGAVPVMRDELFRVFARAEARAEPAPYP